MKKEHENDAPETELQDDVNFEPEEGPSRLVVEDEAELGDMGAAQAKLRKLKTELEKVKSERQEYLDGWQRSKADAVNARQEMARDAIRQGTRAKESIIEDILPVLDSFDMAAGTPAWETVDATWRSGIDHIRNQLLDVLARNGVERFGKIGEAFSPFLHEAVQEMDDVAGDPGSIVRVLRYGYKAGDRIIRPAQVIIKPHA